MTQFIARNLSYRLYCHRTRFLTGVALNCHVIVVIYLPTESFNPEVYAEVLVKVTKRRGRRRRISRRRTRRRHSLRFYVFLNDRKATKFLLAYWLCFVNICIVANLIHERKLLTAILPIQMHQVSSTYLLLLIDLGTWNLSSNTTML